MRCWTLPVISDDEGAEIEVETVLDRRAVDLGNKTARLGERRAVETNGIANATSSCGRPRFNAPMTAT
jgi:hypothetical protein